MRLSPSWPLGGRSSLLPLATEWFIASFHKNKLIRKESWCSPRGPQFCLENGPHGHKKKRKTRPGPLLAVSPVGARLCWGLGDWGASSSSWGLCLVW